MSSPNLPNSNYIRGVKNSVTPEKGVFPEDLQKRNLKSAASTSHPTGPLAPQLEPAKSSRFRAGCRRQMQKLSGSPALRDLVWG